jgi:hypothetical protein
MKIGLIPLDERPVNTRYPKMIGQIAGVEVLIPPKEILSTFRTPADCDAIAEWLEQHIDDLDALIVSVEMLVYGGLIPSRITDDVIGTLLQRLEILRDLKHSHPHLLLFGFNLITRISKHAESVEEPDYWHQAGEQLYQYSQDYDRYSVGQGDAPQCDDISDEHLNNFLHRRLRNHMVNLATMDMLADNVFDLLVVSSDDTSEFGFGTREKAWVKEWVDRRGGDDRLLMYPGADEVGSALLARAIVEAHHAVPRFYIHYAIEADKNRVAPFEDGAVSLTVERQIRAVGGRIVDSVEGTDLIVAVNPPAPSRKDMYDPTDGEEDRAYRQDAVNDFVEKIKTWIDEGQHIIVCDVAYPNGSDPVLVEALKNHVDLTKLSAYGAWNTAGNTIGVALAQGLASNMMEDESAELRFLVHRFVEDYCYMHIARPTISGQHDGVLFDDATIAILVQDILENLTEQLKAFSAFSGWEISNVNLPWKRLFEVDFDLGRA